MARSLLLALVLAFGSSLSATAVLAQTEADPEAEPGPNLFVGDHPPQRVVRTGVVVQRYTIDFEGDEQHSIGQVAVPLYVAIPLGHGLGLSLRTAYASGGGEHLATISGITDAQVGLSYRRPLGGMAEVILGLGVGLPIGGAALELDQLATALLLSRNEFAFEAPTLRQGLRLAPAITIAIPAGPSFAVGFGASYQVRGSFTPFADYDAAYAPGNEMLLTAGFDSQVGRTIFSGDVRLAFYSADEFAGNTLQPGNKISATFQILGAMGQQQMLFLTRYRHRGEGAVGDTPFQVPVADELAVQLGGLFRFGEAADLGLALGARYLGNFGEIGEATESVQNVLALADHQLLFDLSAAPAFRITPGARLVTAFTYTLGLGTLVDLADVTPISGFRAMGGLEVSF